MAHARPRLTSMIHHAAAATALTAAGCAAAQPADRAAAISPAAAQSPFLGEWELDLTRLPDTYGPPPKRVTYAFSDIGSGRWRTDIAITGRDGAVRRIAIEYRRDGQAVPGEGDVADGESAAVMSPAADTLVMSLAKNKGLESVRVYTVSPDGGEMTESAADVNAAGAPFVRDFHFRRIG